MSDARPCGSDAEYLACCGRYLEGAQIPDSAEQLMRSRYCAYVLGYLDYLLATWHPSTRPPTMALNHSGQIKWLGLNVIRAHNDATKGVVEFVARHKVNGQAHRLHEISQFEKENGRWLYISGEVRH